MYKREEIEKIANSIDYSKKFLKDYNGLLITEEQVDILRRYDIEVEKCGSLTEILYLIDEILDSDSDASDLEWVADTLQERNYYEKTNKWWL